MELKEFIKETIGQIAEAIVELNQDYHNHGLIVNPYTRVQGRSVNKDGVDYNLTDIHFRLSLGVAQEAGSAGKIGILSNIINMGAKKETRDSQEAGNIVDFSMPVILPRGDK